MNYYNSLKLLSCWVNSHFQLLDLTVYITCDLYSFRYQKRVSNIIDEVLEWSPKLALSGMMESATDSSNNYTNGGNQSEPDPGSAAETSRDDVGDSDKHDEVKSEQQRDDV